MVLTVSLLRKHAKVSREDSPHVLNISDTDIEATKQEWAGLVLSDVEWFLHHHDSGLSVAVNFFYNHNQIFIPHIACAMNRLYGYRNFLCS